MRFSFGPSIGGEFLFSKHFSIAGELGLFYFNVTEKDNDNSYDTNSTYILTDTGLILRFYF